MANRGKSRLDALLVARDLAETGSRARALIMAGKVFSAEKRLDKAGQIVADDLPLEVRGRDHPWASRGGVKLAHALDHFGFNPDGRVCLDIGASTGGFADVLLARGATKIYAVDVGRGQIDPRLGADSRVIVLDGVNARYLTRAQIPDPPGFITCDASFISVTKVLGAALNLAAVPAALVALIKPQFEAGKSQVGKGGIVRDPVVHTEVCARVETWLRGQPGWSVHGIEPAPITGAKGNIEFLICASRT
ncbi:MAG: TlyA family RNA methyltransferase [Alphaproteobacteria bacterium]|mgnify:CR=1 FL=1|jgi:23S rRNA (cytidine1920-2'-O)/16S rRNA (cytidine1409-2'-O)-methyltransferase|nr:TlyA family RNA methyltransferase [Alphaproteobacteria bacterium]